MKTIVTNSAEETEHFAAQLGGLLTGGECVELVADLGGGKTTFTRGLVRGAGSHDIVASPTYTISKMYQTPQFAVHHFDFYRLPEAGLMQYELADVMHDPQVVLVVEWGDVVADILPAERLRIVIAARGDTIRELTCTYGEAYKEMVEKLC